MDADGGYKPGTICPCLQLPSSVIFFSNLIPFSYITTTRNIDSFHTNKRTNYIHDHIWSPFLMICIVIAITIPVFNITPIQTSSYTPENLVSETIYYFFWKYNIWYSYTLQEFLAIFLRFYTKPKIQFYLSKYIVLRATYYLGYM